MSNRIVAENMADLYRQAAEKYEGLPAFATRMRANKWQPVSFRELFERGRNLATGLIEIGVEARDHVGLFGDNRFEWILCDCAIQLCGSADVPRGRDVTDDELLYIIYHANIKVAFAETEALQDKILRIKPNLPELQKVILMDPKATPSEGVHALEDVEERGKKLRDDGDRRVEDRMADISSEDLFTLIYTSGTTGKPKGVMLTHANMMSQMKVIPIDLTFTDRVLSILPVWHIFERVFEVYTISCGVCTYYSNIRTLAEDLKYVDPTFMGSAPRLWENLHKRITDNVRKAHPVRRALFYISRFLGRNYHSALLYIRNKHLKIQPESVFKNVILRVLNFFRWVIVIPLYGFFNATVLEQIRLQTTGGSLKATISGGGALPAEIDQFLNSIGIPVLEGYGLTETSPVLAVRTPKDPVIGTVGPPVPETEIRIADPESGDLLYPNDKYPYQGRGMRGEVLVRGPQVMRGYYQEPELTDNVIRDGWFHTGDLGMITHNDCLKILGRHKSTIVLSNGENLEPEPIEMRLNQSRYIKHCMVVGQDQREIGALIVPDLDELKEVNVKSESLEEAVNDEQVHRIIKDEIRNKIINSKDFRYYEKIRRYQLLDEYFTVGQELTNLFKIKRHVIQDKYEDTIRKLFTDDALKI